MLEFFKSLMAQLSFSITNHRAGGHRHPGISPEAAPLKYRQEWVQPKAHYYLPFIDQLAAGSYWREGRGRG